MLTFFGNLFFLHTIITPVYGTNGPLWSLANEFWYYAAFPLLIITMGLGGYRTRILFRAVAGIVAGLLLFWLPGGIVFGFVIWLLGIIVHFARNRIESQRRPWVLLLTLILFLLTLAYSKALGWQAALHLPGDLAVGLGFAALCTVLATSPPPGRSLLGTTVTQFAKATSEISYSLYLCHFPFVILIAVFGYGAKQVVPGAAAFAVYLGWLAALICLGALFWFLFEKRTDVVKKLVIARLRS